MPPGWPGKIFDRLEQDPAYLDVEQKPFLQAMFGLLGDARFGLTEDDLADILVGVKRAPNKEMARAAVRYYARQLRPFLIWRGGRLNFLYATWHALCRQRYGGRWHSALAFRFFNLCDAQSSGPYLGQEPLPFREFSYHTRFCGNPAHVPGSSHPAGNLLRLGLGQAAALRRSGLAGRGGEWT